MDANETNDHEAGRQALLNRYYRARDDVLARAGRLSSDVLAPVVNPAFMGGPMWPDLRQAYKFVALDGGGTLLVTDGLSDPFRDGHHHFHPSASGYELEVYLVTDEALGVEASNWQVSLLVDMANQVAGFGGLRQLLDEHRLLSMVLHPTVTPPAGFTNDDGQTCVLLGLPGDVLPDQVELPLGPATLVSMTLLTTTEEQEVARGGAERRAVADRFLARHGQPISTVNRSSV